MYYNKIGSFFTRIFVLLIGLKLSLSVFVKEEGDLPLTNSIFTNLYYITDIGIFFLLVLGLIIYFNYSRNKDKKIFKIYFYLFCLILLVGWSSFINNIAFFVGVTGLLKFTLPLLVLMFLVTFKPYITNKLTWVLPLLVVIFSVFAILFLDKSYNRGEFFWPVYFSGLHSQAYVVLAAFFMIYYKFFEKDYIKGLILITLGTFYCLMVGYNVRTSGVSFLSFLLFIIGFKLWNSQFKGVVGILTYIIFSSAFLFYLNSFDLEKYDMDSSGRLSVYLERIEFIKNRESFQNVFGSGPGSDMMLSSTWWWEEKGSHNDYLTIFIEYGLVYLVIFIMLFVELFKFFKKDYLIIAVLTAYIVSSLLSNGFMFRPAASYLLFLNIGFIFLLNRQNYNNINS